MQFGTLQIKDAVGGILAHSLSLKNGRRLRKGLIITEEIILQLAESEIDQVITAMPDEGDVLEDVAATLIAQQLDVEHVRVEDANTGRVNIFACSNGIFQVSKSAVDALNAVYPDITIATLPDYTPVNEGRLVATIKIIPYAVKSCSLETALALNLTDTIKLHPFKSKRVGMISTMLPALKTSVMGKTRDNLERRLALSGSLILEELRVEHNEKEITEAINKLSPNSDLLILFGASAISDIADCIPTAIKMSGGVITRFGMPVDPGNLLLLGKLGDKPIIGAPGCARSIAENGFDWILQRLLADIEVSSEDIMGLGVGGLLMETGSRPHPREKQSQASTDIAAIILAAGQSRRMGEMNKMTVELHGKPMVRHVGDAVTSSEINITKVVTGHMSDDVSKALQGLNIEAEHNPDYEEGLSTSLVSGIKSLPKNVSAALILLGDMPFLTNDMINQLVNASKANPDHIIVSTHEGKRGNPVLWPRRFFDELTTITGDVGARHIMAANHDRVLEVELGEAASLDLDTPDAVQMAQNREQ